MLWHGERNNETENKRNNGLFIPGIVYAGNVSLLAIYWILIKKALTEKSASAFYSAIEHGERKEREEIKNDYWNM